MRYYHPPTPPLPPPPPPLSPSLSFSLSLRIFPALSFYLFIHPSIYLFISFYSFGRGGRRGRGGGRRRRRRRRLKHKLAAKLRQVGSIGRNKRRMMTHGGNGTGAKRVPISNPQRHLADHSVPTTHQPSPGAETALIAHSPIGPWSSTHLPLPCHPLIEPNLTIDYRANFNQSISRRVAIRMPACYLGAAAIQHNYRLLSRDIDWGVGGEGWRLKGGRGWAYFSIRSIKAA